ncbi:MAG: AIR synthase-related protein, partial [Deltaproteobacteria bacterium]
DITGFGLLGHAMGMAEASSVSMTFKIRDIPFFPKALQLVKKSANHPKIIKSNREYLSPNVKMSDEITSEQATLLYDPQTSGGLLISVPSERLTQLIDSLSAAKILGAVIGEITEKRTPVIAVE